MTIASHARKKESADPTAEPTLQAQRNGSTVELTCNGRSYNEHLVTANEHGLTVTARTEATEFSFRLNALARGCYFGIANDRLSPSCAPRLPLVFAVDAS